MEMNKLEVQVLEDAISNAAEVQILSELELVLVGGGSATVDFG